MPKVRRWLPLWTRRATEPSDPDAALLAALRRGDEEAFMALVERYSAAMLRVALLYVADRAAAEDAVQDAWLGVLRGLDRFEERSSLRTWIFRILMNCAQTRGQKDARSIPFSLLGDTAEDGAPAGDPDWFDPRSAAWRSAPRSWAGEPEARALAAETRGRIQQAILALPPRQRQVITLRDVDGWSAAEVSELLGLSEGNQRVLLHRARTSVRRALAEDVAADRGAR